MARNRKVFSREMVGYDMRANYTEPEKLFDSVVMLGYNRIDGGKLCLQLLKL